MLQLPVRSGPGALIHGGGVWGMHGSGPGALNLRSQGGVGDALHLLGFDRSQGNALDMCQGLC